ncbi:MAG: small multi-drug export protein [Steroidobacteraceae bacterium]
MSMPPIDPPRHLLLATPEGRILLFGLLGVLLLAIGIGLAWLVAPEQAFTYIVMAGLNLSIGRAAGMSFGYASGLGHEQVIPINMLIETVQVIVVYPLFALTWTHLIDTPRWNALMGRMRAAATQHQGRVQRYGIVGLFFFVFTPFWMTGPVVGAIIGFLIGLRPWVNLGVVLGATYIAIGVWALLLNELNRWLGAYNQLAPFALVMALILLALSGKLLRSPRNGQRPT